MKDFIIPVDFSETSLNAARYAADMLSGKPDSHVILYNMFKHEDDSCTRRAIPRKPESRIGTKRSGNILKW